MNAVHNYSKLPSGHSNVWGDSKNQIFVTCTSLIEGDNSGDNSNDDKDDSVNTDSHLS